MLYLFSFIVAVAGLAALFFFRQNAQATRRLQALLAGSLAVYLFSVFSAAGTMDYKLGVAFRDLLIIAVSGLAFMYIARMRRAFWLSLLLLAGGLGVYFKTVLQPSFPMPTATEFALDPEAELLVELPAGAEAATLQNILDKYDLTASRAFRPADPDITELDDYLAVDIPEHKLRYFDAIKEELRANGLTDWVEENEQIRLSPLESEQPPSDLPNYGLNDPGVEQLWAFEALRIGELFDILAEENLKPRRKAVIAILDTGVDSQHEDLKGNYQSTQPKYDNDPQGHGTHCAGIAGAVSNNGVGVASFSTDNAYVTLTSIKVLSASGMGTQRTIINGITEAADQRVDVISLSLGGRSNQAKQKAYEKAVKYANKKGAIVVAAAGNSNRNAREYAPVNAPGVIGVSAVDQEIQRAPFSNYVTDIEMGLAAPGVQIYSTKPDGNYAAHNGTSMATPYVSGLVGLLKSIQPDLTTKEVYELLNRTGDDTKNTRETGRLIQPAAAVSTLIQLR